MITGTNKRKIKLIRLSIYLLGISAVLTMLLLNFYKNKQQTFSFDHNNKDVPNYFEVNSIDNFDWAEIYIEVDQIQDIDGIKLNITKALSVLSREKKDAIADSARLAEILFDNSVLGMPNGTIISHKNNLFLLTESELRKFKSKAIFNMLGFNESLARKISSKEFASLEIGENIDEQLFVSEKLPYGVIIKSGDDFFITGSTRIYPIFSESLILDLWKEYSYANTSSLSPNNMLASKCYKQNEYLAYCEADLAMIESNFGDVYYIKIQGIAKEYIKKVDIKLVKKATLANLTKLLW
jgi:hypothetical protein